MRALRAARVASILALAAAVSLGAPTVAGAGETALEGQVGYRRMNASNSASAVFGSDDGLTFGGAVRHTFWHGLFASLGVRTFSKTGERVFVSAPNAPVQKLGFPVKMRTTPILLSAGYRLRNGRMIVPYVTAGGAFALYSEKSDVAGESFDASFSKAGFLGAVGVEVGRGRFRLGAEAGWTTVPNAIGQASATDLGGVAAVYREDDIGGKYAVGKLVIVLFQ